MRGATGEVVKGGGTVVWLGRGEKRGRVGGTDVVLKGNKCEGKIDRCC